MAEMLKHGTAHEQLPKCAMYDTRLSDKAFRLLYILKSETNSKTDLCSRSYEDLSELTGWSSFTTVKKAVQELVEAGWITIERKGGIATSGFKTRNAYKVNVNHTTPDECNRQVSFKMEHKEGKFSPDYEPPKETPTPATTPKLKGVKKKSTPPKKVTPPQTPESENVTALLRKLFTLEAYGFMPNYDGEYKEVWQKLYKDYKAMLSSGERVLTEETLQQEMKFVRRQYQTAVGSI